VDIPSLVFYGFFGTVKLSGLLALVGAFGPSYAASLYGNICWLVLLLASVYHHLKKKESPMLVAVCLAIILLRLLVVVGAVEAVWQFLKAQPTMLAIAIVLAWIFAPFGLFFTGCDYLVAFRPSRAPEGLREKFEKTREVWCSIFRVDIPSLVFYGFFGTVKLSGLLALVGAFGPSYAASLYGNICWLVLLLASVYHHLKKKESPMLVAMCLAIILLRLLVVVGVVAGLGQLLKSHRKMAAFLQTFPQH